MAASVDKIAMKRDTEAALAKAVAKVPSKRAEAGKRNVSGVWMVYLADTTYSGPVVVSPHADELEARRAAMDGAADSRVVFVSWGQTVVEALNGR